MLTKIREKVAGPIGLVILGVIALSFVFFGASLNLGGNVYAAKVNGSEIGINAFENTYRQQLEQNPQLASLPPEFRAQYRQSIVESLIRERLVELHLVDAGYQISEAQLTAAIQRVPEFLVDGKFHKIPCKTEILLCPYSPVQRKIELIPSPSDRHRINSQVSCYHVQIL